MGSPQRALARTERAAGGGSDYHGAPVEASNAPPETAARVPTMSARFNHAAALALAFLTLACGDGVVPALDVSAPQDTTDASGPYEIRVVITDDGAIERAVLRWFVEGGGSPKPIALVREGETALWRAALPGQAAGTVVHFTVEVEDDEGHVAIAPSTKSADGTPGSFSFTVSEP